VCMQKTLHSRMDGDTAALMRAWLGVSKSSLAGRGTRPGLAGELVPVIEMTLLAPGPRS
jgi:hypothetical protein